MPDHMHFCQDLIKRALSNSRELPRMFRLNASNTWLGEAALQITAIHDHEEPILYIGGTMNIPKDATDLKDQVEHGLFGGTVVAFSKSYFYWTEADGRGVRTTTFPLALRRLTVEEAQGGMVNGFYQEPSRIGVTVTFPNDVSFHLPITPGSTRDGYDELQEALPALRNALMQASAEVTATR